MILHLNLSRFWHQIKLLWPIEESLFLVTVAILDGVQTFRIRDHPSTISAQVGYNCQSSFRGEYSSNDYLQEYALFLYLAKIG